MSDNWIYVGADIHDHNWSKVGKTTRGLHTRHTSSQRPGYFIFTAYNIIWGNVHEIESHLLDLISNEDNIIRQVHYSTGSESECFSMNPINISGLVEYFIERYYPGCVYFDNLTDSLSRYQCVENVYKNFDRKFTQPADLNDWFNLPDAPPIPDNLNLTKRKYFTGNQVKREEDLGHGYFLDYESGREGFRHEDGSVEWKEWK